MKERRALRKPLAILLLACVLPCMPMMGMLAWEQDEHMKINGFAYEQFITLYQGAGKFKDAPVDQNLKLPGPYTTSASLFASGKTANGLMLAAGLKIPVVGAVLIGRAVMGKQITFSDYAVESQYHTLREWVTHGGYSADEPEMYASVRHFYDPKATDGHPELTDQENLHGFYDQAISALEWAYTHPENAFSFARALEYYKKAMEIPEDGAQPAAIPALGGNGSFRDLAFTPELSEQARRFLLGKAFRALGESMHMISDMAMPAHVRNDSHPYSDSIETPLKPEMITASKDFAAEPVDLGGTPRENFVTLAGYTNEHFFTHDTISIPEYSITPRNWEKAYDQPRLEDLKPEKSGNRTTYYGQFTQEPVKVPLLVEETMVMAVEGASQEIPIFSVPAGLGHWLCDKLVPLAIKASARTMYDFFPTLSLLMAGVEEELEPEERDLGYQGKFRLSSALTHEVEEDPAWAEAGIAIRYSGPGALYRQRKDKKEWIADLIYEDGALIGVRTSGKGEAFSAYLGPIVLYAAPEHTKATAPEGFPEELAFERFMIQDGDRLSILIQAGGRSITGEPWVYKPEGAEVVIQPPRITTYELLEGARSAEHSFEAVARPAGDYRFVWDFGDGSPGEETTGATSAVRHAYEGPGEYHPAVHLYGVEKGEALSSDQVTVILQCKAAEATASPGTGNRTYRIQRQPVDIDYETVLDPQTLIAHALGKADQAPFTFSDKALTLQIPALSFQVAWDNMAQKYAESGIPPPERTIEQSSATISATFSHMKGVEGQYGYQRVYKVNAGTYQLKIVHRSWRKNFPNDPDVSTDAWDLDYSGEIVVSEHGSLSLSLLVNGTYTNMEQGPVFSHGEEVRELKDVPLVFTLDLAPAE